MSTQTVASANEIASEWLALARHIHAERQFEMIDGIILDAYTASMLLAVYDNLNAVNAAKFAAMPLLKAVNLGWKLHERASR